MPQLLLRAVAEVARCSAASFEQTRKLLHFRRVLTGRTRAGRRATPARGVL